MIEGLNQYPISTIFLILVFGFILIILPYILIRSFVIVKINDTKISIQRAFAFSRRNITIESIKGYSISHAANSKNIFGLIKFYSTNGNFEVSSAGVSNLNEVLEYISKLDITFLGYEPQRFNWTWKQFGRRKYLFDEATFSSDEDNKEFYLKELNPPKLKSLLWFLPLFLIWSAMFLTAPIADLITRNNSYLLHHHGEVTYGKFIKCEPKIMTKRSGTSYKMIKAHYGYVVDKKKYTGFIKYRGEECPEQYSKIKLRYYSENPEKHRVIK